MKLPFFIAVLLGGMILVDSVHAAEPVVDVGRYLTAQAATTDAQRDPLQTQYQGTFPGNVKTLSEAITYLLTYSGYQLSVEKNLLLAKTLSQALPQSVRTIGPVTIQDALIALMGQPYQLLVDPVHRLVSFRLKPVYQTLY